MKDFTASTGFITAFLIGTIFIQMIAGNKVTEAFLWLVLASMIVVNADKFKTLAEGVMKK